MYEGKEKLSFPGSAYITTIYPYDAVRRTEQQLYLSYVIYVGAP